MRCKGPYGYNVLSADCCYDNLFHAAVGSVDKQEMLSWKMMEKFNMTVIAAASLKAGVMEYLQRNKESLFQ